MRFAALLLSVSACLFLATNASAQACSCDSIAGSEETIVTADSTQGRHITMRIAANPVGHSAVSAFVCSDSDATLARARLWMPAHGHGSGPTRVTAETSTCSRVERMVFSMSGDWEVQLGFADSDAATLSVGID